MLPDLTAQFGAAEERAQAAASQLADELESANKASKARHWAKQPSPPSAVAVPAAQALPALSADPDSIRVPPL